MKTIKYSRFLDYMIIRVGEPLSGIKSLMQKCPKYMKLVVFDTKLNRMNDIWRRIFWN